MQASTDYLSPKHAEVGGKLNQSHRIQVTSAPVSVQMVYINL